MGQFTFLFSLLFLIFTPNLEHQEIPEECFDDWEICFHNDYDESPKIVPDFEDYLKGDERNIAYINHFKESAINEMIENDIPASITIAQAILESGSGSSSLAKKANNHFGIKCFGCDEFVTANDDKPNEKFVRYKNAADSFSHHSKLLLSKRYRWMIGCDYEFWAHGLTGVYATDKNYHKKLIYLIERYNLNRYDETTKFSIS